jgi:hypothetical protein
MMAMRLAASSLLFAAALSLTSVAAAQGNEGEEPASATEEAAPPARAPIDDDAVSDADKERARVLFDEGRQFMADGKVKEACDKFGESNKVRPGIGTLYNLADCNEKIGKTGTAYTLFVEVADRTKAALQTDREEKARERMAALQPRLMKIKVAVPGKGKVKAVTIDGEVVEPENYNKAIVMDPGEHTVMAVTVKDDGEPFEETIELEEEGKTVIVAIPVAPGAKMKPRVGMIVGGAITMGVGAIALVGAGFLGSSGDPDAMPAAIGLGILGVAGLGVGIPVFAVGFKKKPVREGELEYAPYEVSPIPQVAIGPTGGSMTWQF